MSVREPDEQDLIDLYRRYREAPATAGVDTGDGADIADTESAIASSSRLASSLEMESPEEGAVVSDYVAYKRDRAVARAADEALVASIVEQCVPILNQPSFRPDAGLQARTERSKRHSPEPWLTRWRRILVDYVSAPSGALVATAIVAGVVLFPVLNTDQDELAVFVGGDTFSENSSLAGLGAYYPQSVTRNSALPSREQATAYHYNIGRLVAGLAVAVRGDNADNGPVFASQLSQMTATDPNIDTDRIAALADLWDASTQAKPGENEREIEQKAALDRLFDDLNGRALSPAEKSLEQLGAWTLGARIVVRATSEKADVESDLLMRFIKDFPEFSAQVQRLPDLQLKQRRSLQEFESIARQVADQPSEIGAPHLAMLSEGLDTIHIAFKN